ncbi:MAG: Flp family type IVb pilin [Actinomycetota bacterium]
MKSVPRLWIWLVDKMTDAAREDRGAAAVEYGLLVGLIAVVIITAVMLLGGKINDTFCSVVAALPFGSGTC